MIESKTQIVYVGQVTAGELSTEIESHFNSKEVTERLCLDQIYDHGRREEGVVLEFRNKQTFAISIAEGTRCGNNGERALLLKHLLERFLEANDINAFAEKPHVVRAALVKLVRES